MSEDTATGAAKLNVDDHVHAIAKAMQASHFPDIAEIESAAPTYIDDAKAFIAAFNAAIEIMGNLQRTIHPQQHLLNPEPALGGAIIAPPPGGPQTATQ